MTAKPNVAEASSTLEVVDLKVRFFTPFGTVGAVNGVDLNLERGGTLAILGESGSGKSVTSRAIAQLVQEPPGKVTATSIRVGGQELVGASQREREAVRGKKVAMIFQDATRALNPGLTIERQLTEVYRRRTDASKKEARERALDKLVQVGLASPKKRLGEYPHQLSGGMCQRVMIAMALMLEPELLIADEPTTALDVTVQAQIMALLSELQENSGMAMMLITHDVAVAGEVADEIAVMYAGRIVEHGPAASILTESGHPYTRGLLEAIPRPHSKGARLTVIPGAPPVMTEIRSGCAFHPRCPWAEDVCSKYVPALETVGAAVRQHRAACHFKDELDATSGQPSASRMQ